MKTLDLVGVFGYPAVLLLPIPMDALNQALNGVYAKFHDAIELSNHPTTSPTGLELLNQNAEPAAISAASAESLSLTHQSRLENAKNSNYFSRSVRK
ncbi:MAG: hypothetical protein AAF468_17000 [Pseudomonadota bacterium]